MSATRSSKGLVKSKSSLASGWACSSRSTIFWIRTRFLARFDLAIFCAIILVLRENMLAEDQLQTEERKMDVNELRKMTTPKLRDLAKQETDIKGVGGMEKEELIKAIAKAQGIAYDESTKDINAIHAVKQDIRRLKKQKAEMLASSPDR